jgi:hypothetical protein
MAGRDVGFRGVRSEPSGAAPVHPPDFVREGQKWADAFWGRWTQGFRVLLHQSRENQARSFAHLLRHFIQNGKNDIEGARQTEYKRIGKALSIRVRTHSKLQAQMSANL